MRLALGGAEKSEKKKHRKHLYCHVLPILQKKDIKPFCGNRAINQSAAQVSNPMELLALIELAGQ